MKVSKRLISLLLLILMIFSISPFAYADPPGANYTESGDVSKFANGKGGVWSSKHQGWRM